MTALFEVTILMPCLNEAETLKTCIDKALSWAKTSNTKTEVIIADNGSTDGSQKIAIGAGARVVDVPTRGYGAALYAGAKSANSKFIIMGDSDDSYDFSKLDPFVAGLRNGNDLVMGNRFAGGIEQGAMPWKNRHIGNPVLSWIGRVLFRIPIRDFHCGLRGFTKEAFEKMDLRTTGMEFASEMVIKAQLLGMEIAEVPTTLSKDGRSRPPHLKPWRDGWRHLRFMLSLSPKWLFIFPGTALLFGGLSLYVPLLFWDLSFGSIVLSVNTLYAAQGALILGYVSLILGTAIRVFAVRERLLPDNAIVEKLKKINIFEFGTIAGLAFIGMAIALGANTISFWAATGYGNLSAGVLIRQISAASTFLITGGLTVLASLLFGFLTLPIQKDQK